MAEENKKVSFGEKIKKFFKDYKSEFKKISWPSRSETTKKTITVIIAVVVVSVCILGVDLAFSGGIDLLAKVL